MNNKNNKEFVKLTLAKFVLPLGAMLSHAAYSEGLLEAYQIAAKRDPVLQQAFANFKSVEKNIPISVANLLPEVTLNAGISYDKVLDFNVGPNDDDKNPHVVSKYISLNFTQPLFHWDKISRYLQTKIEVEKAIHDLEIAKEDLLIRVSTAYFNILEAMDYLEFVSTEKIAVKEMLDQSTEKFNVGFIAITDVEEAKAKYNIKESEEIAAQNEVANRFEELTAILGQKLTSLNALIPKYTPSTPKPNDIAQWVKMALARNHTLRSETLATSIMAKNEDIAFAGHLPNFDFNARYRAVDSSRGILVDQIITADGFVSSYGASIEGNLELYGGGGTQAAVEKAEFNTRAAKYNTERVKREVVSDSRQYYRNVLTAIQQVKALEQAVKSGMSALESTQASYEVGTRASIDVLDRLTELYNQKEKLAAARYAYIKNVLELKRVTGTLTNNDVNTVDRWLISRSSSVFKQDKTAVRDNVLDVIRKVTGQPGNDTKQSTKLKTKQNAAASLSPEEIEKRVDEKSILNKSQASSNNLNSTKALEENNTVKELEEKLKQLENEDSTINNSADKKPLTDLPKSTTTTTTTTTKKVESETKNLESEAKDLDSELQKSGDYEDTGDTKSTLDKDAGLENKNSAITTTTTTTTKSKVQPALTEQSDIYEPLDSMSETLISETPIGDSPISEAQAIETPVIAKPAAPAPTRTPINNDPAVVPTDDSLKALEEELQTIIKQGGHAEHGEQYE